MLVVGKRTENTANTNDLCTTCGLKSGTSGSMTTWILRGGRCKCNIDAVARQTSNGQILTRPVGAQGSRPAGRVLNERYQLLEPVGRGGVCLVYKAEDLTTKEVVALKLMRPEFAEHEQAVQRLIKEVDTAAQLIHQNLVRVHGYGQDRKGESYLVMDFVAGENLDELMIKSGGRLEPRRALEVFTQICEGLKCAHAHGVIHRDLKPSNIIITPEAGGRETVKIVDFGFAKLTETGDSSLRLTQTGEVFGSPFYMSPEHCLGKELDARSDIYSLGCLMYETLSGCPPLKGDNVLATVAKQVTEEPASMRTLHRSISESLDNVVLRCLAKEPVLRYQCVSDLLSDLHSLRSGKHIKAPLKAAKRPSYEVKSLRIREMSGFKWAGLLPTLLTIVLSGSVALVFMSMHKPATTAVITPAAVISPARKNLKPKTNPKTHLPSLQAGNASSITGLTDKTQGATNPGPVEPSKATERSGLRPQLIHVAVAAPLHHVDRSPKRAALPKPRPAKKIAPTSKESSKGWAELKELRTDR